MNMTREEQIEQKAKEYGQKCFPDENNIWARENIEAKYVEFAFIAGVKWADETMIEKACKWLYEELGDGFYFYDAVVSKSFTNTQDFINAFKKAMEEQL